MQHSGNPLWDCKDEPEFKERCYSQVSLSLVQQRQGLLLPRLHGEPGGSAPMCKDNQSLGQVDVPTVECAGVDKALGKWQ